MAIIATRIAKKSGGRGVKPKKCVNGVNGKSAPASTTAIVVNVSAVLARLRKNGTRRVRIRKTTSDCVASDSTNQPVRKSSGPALKMSSITAKVAKSKIDEIGPKNAMKRRMNFVSQWDGRSSISSSTLSVGIVISLTS